MKTQTYVLFLTLAPFCTLFQSGCKTTETAPSSGSASGQFLTSYGGYQKKSKLDDRLVYHGNLEKVHQFRKIYLEEVAVLRPSDMAKKKITTEDLMRLQQLFRTTLQNEIAGTRFELASGPGPGTLSVRTAVVDIHPGNPAMFAVGSAPYVGAATTVAGVATGAKFGRGSAKVEGEMLDSMTRERIVGIIDEDVGSKLEIVQGLSRWGHVELAMKHWAKRFGKFLADPTSFSS